MYWYKCLKHQNYYKLPSDRILVMPTFILVGFDEEAEPMLIDQHSLVYLGKADDPLDIVKEL